MGGGEGSSSEDGNSSDDSVNTDDSFDELVVAPTAASARAAPRTSQDLSQHMPVCIDVASGMRHARPLRAPRRLQPNASACGSRSREIQYVCNCAHGVRGLGCCIDVGGDLFEYAREQHATARR
jgi:hypothetical protein